MIFNSVIVCMEAKSVGRRAWNLEPSQDLGARIEDLGARIWNIGTLELWNPGTRNQEPGTKNQYFCRCQVSKKNPELKP
jgi:hypothetical protein